VKRPHHDTHFVPLFCIKWAYRGDIISVRRFHLRSYCNVSD